MIVKDLVDLRYDTPFVIKGIEYGPKDIPRPVQLMVVDKVDVRMDKDGIYKSFIEVLDHPYTNPT